MFIISFIGLFKFLSEVFFIPPLGAFKRSYQKPYFIRYVASTADSFKASTQAEKKNPEFFETLVQEKENIWEAIEHDITDVVTFDIVKQQYLERLEEISQEHRVETIPMKSDKSPDIKAKKKVKKKAKPPLAKYTRNSQLTHNGEQNVLAEIDVYLYLGEVSGLVRQKTWVYLQSKFASKTSFKE